LSTKRGPFVADAKTGKSRDYRDLPRPLQQILFDAADGIASPDPAWASSTDAKVK
jgi:hypothetical protein